MMRPEYDIEMCIVSNPAYLCVVRATICTALERLGLDECECGKVMLAVDEALTNVIRHGYNGDNSQPIWVRFNPKTENGSTTGFVIVIEDVAEQVDPEQIRGRDLEDIRPGGLGVHIIRQVMDDVQYTKRPEGGMRLYMAKSVSPGKVTQP